MKSTAVYTVDVTESKAEPVAATARREVLRSELRTLGLERGITSIRRLSGGYVADAWLVTYADGRQVAAESLTGAPADVFQAEAEGLAALRTTGHLSTPISSR